MQLEEFDIEFLSLKMSENPRSMLFARLADLYLTKEQNAEAMKLLEEGIPVFPWYYAGYLVLGKAHLAFKEYSRASAAFSKALELSPFNQTAAQLLAAVPNKPDESTRTTDENYFALPGTAPQPVPAATAPAPEPMPEPEPEQVFTAPAYEEPVMETFEVPSIDQTETAQQVFDPYAEAIAAAAEASSAAAQQRYAEPELQTAQQSDEAFPTYDEYFAQNQHRINIESPIRLDDYLSGAAPAVSTDAPVIEEMPQHEFVNESYVEPDASPFTPVSVGDTPEMPTPASPEPHFDPEPVFSSPEQAQLFAELTGSDEPASSSYSTDLDSLTEKLQSAEKIVPEANYQPKTPVPKETPDEQAYETDAVTPTLAEIYASQGEYRAAIQAYEILMFSQPAKGGEFQQRIRELQQLQMEKDGLI
jgi:tetratricopeptide (TPR) repeat protein